jgi:Spy/CpxP family protein refolding chaperone
MFRRCRLEVIGLAVVCVLAASITAEGQQRRGDGPRGGFDAAGGGGRGLNSPLMLLRSEQVQQELKLSEAQKTRLQELNEKIRAEMRERFSGTNEQSREERRARMEQMREQMQKEAETRAAETFKQVAEILEPEQLKRLKQIQLQQEGPAALRRAEVAEAIGLTAEQKAQLDKLATETEEATRKLREGTENLSREQRRERFDELRQKSQELRDQFGKNAMALLQPEQKQKLAELFGEPFELDRSQLFQNRGREGGREGGRRRGAGQRPE